MQKRKIYWFIQQDSIIGGTEMVTTQIVNFLSDVFEMHLVVVATPDKNTPYKISENVKVETLNLPVECVHFDSFFKTYWSKGKIFKCVGLFFKTIHNYAFGRFKYQKKVQEMIAKDDIIVVSSQELLTFMPKDRYVYEHFHYNSTLYNRFIDKMLRLTHRKPNYRIYLSNSTKEALDKNGTNSTYIYNPIRYEPVLNEDYHNNNLIFIGRLEEQKDPMFLLRSIKEFDTFNIPYSLKIFGKGSLRTKMDKYIEENKLNNVTIIDNCFDMKPILLESDLLLSTSRYEGLPLVSLEANALSCPVLWTDIKDPIPDVVVEGYNGYVVRERDPKAYALKIKEILTNKEQLLAMKKNAYDISFKYNKDTLKAKWVELFSK